MYHKIRLFESTTSLDLNRRIIQSKCACMITLTEFRKKNRFFFLHCEAHSWTWNRPIILFCFVLFFRLTKQPSFWSRPRYERAALMKQDDFVIYLYVELWNDLHQCQLTTTTTTTMLIRFFYSLFCFVSLVVCLFVVVSHFF